MSTIAHSAKYVVIELCPHFDQIHFASIKKWLKMGTLPNMVVCRSSEAS